MRRASPFWRRLSRGQLPVVVCAPRRQPWPWLSHLRRPPSEGAACGGSRHRWCGAAASDWLIGSIVVQLQFHWLWRRWRTAPWSRITVPVLFNPFVQKASCLLPNVGVDYMSGPVEDSLPSRRLRSNTPCIQLCSHDPIGLLVGGVGRRVITSFDASAMHLSMIPSGVAEAFRQSRGHALSSALHRC